MLRLNILDHFIQGCNRETATYEFIGMLAVFALLGFILRHVLSNSGNKLNKLEEENLNLKLNISNLEEQVNDLQLTNAVLEKKLKDQDNPVYQEDEKPRVQTYQTSNFEEEIQLPIETIEEKFETTAVTEPLETNSIDAAAEGMVIADVEEKELVDTSEEERLREEAHQERIRIERERILKEMEEERKQEQEETRRKLKLILEGQAINEMEKKQAEEKQVQTEQPASEANEIDDLKVIEGVGPAIERILTGAGIVTYKQLSSYTGSQIHEILSQAGPRFKVHDPTTWPEQAKLLSEGKMEEFKQFTSQLIAGKKRQD